MDIIFISLNLPVIIHSKGKGVEIRHLHLVKQIFEVLLAHTKNGSDWVRKFGQYKILKSSKHLRVLLNSQYPLFNKDNELSGSNSWTVPQHV